MLSTASWTEWSSWSSCSVTCGGGTKTSERTCSDPEGTGGSCGEGQETTKTKPCGAKQCRKFSKVLAVFLIHPYNNRMLSI